MRKIFLIALVLFCSVVGHGQVSSQNARRIISGTGVPNATCTPGPSWTSVYIRTTTGVIYYCSAAPSTWTPLPIAASGAITTSGLTMATNKLLGRGTASTGAVEEITLGTNLSLAGTTLNATGGPTMNSTDGVIPYRSSATVLANSPLIRADANTIEQRNVATAQTWRLYATHTDASNYERLAVGFNGASYTIRAEEAGTGFNTRNLAFSSGSGGGGIFFNTSNGDRWTFNAAGHFLALTDNSFDIGASGATRPRTGHFGTSIVTPIHYYTSTVFDSAGSGSPEGVLTAGIGSTYRRTDGGAVTSFYVKESGAGNTGWVAK